MMVDSHRRGSGVDGSSGPGAASVSAAVAAVVATAPAHADMHRVLSAPMLSPPASHDRSSGMDPSQNRLPPLRQDHGDGRKSGGFNASSMSENGSAIDLSGPPPPQNTGGLSRDPSTMRSPRSHMRHLSESALPSAAMAAAAAVALQTEPMDDSGWSPAHSIRRACLD